MMREDDTDEIVDDSSFEGPVESVWDLAPSVYWSKCVVCEAAEPSVRMDFTALLSAPTLTKRICNLIEPFLLGFSSSGTEGPFQGMLVTPQRSCWPIVHHLSLSCQLPFCPLDTVEVKRQDDSFPDPTIPCVCFVDYLPGHDQSQCAAWTTLLARHGYRMEKLVCLVDGHADVLWDQIHTRDSQLKFPCSSAQGLNAHSSTSEVDLGSSTGEEACQEHCRRELEQYWNQSLDPLRHKATSNTFPVFRYFFLWKPRDFQNLLKGENEEKTASRPPTVTLAEHAWNRLTGIVSQKPQGQLWRLCLSDLADKTATPPNHTGSPEEKSRGWFGDFLKKNQDQIVGLVVSPLTVYSLFIKEAVCSPPPSAGASPTPVRISEAFREWLGQWRILCQQYQIFVIAEIPVFYEDCAVAEEWERLWDTMRIREWAHGTLISPAHHDVLVFLQALGQYCASMAVFFRDEADQRQLGECVNKETQKNFTMEDLGLIKKKVSGQILLPASGFSSSSSSSTRPKRESWIKNLQGEPLCSVVNTMV